jgi:hypothetical protein
MGVIEKTNQVGPGLGSGRVKTAVANYDFAVDGGKAEAHTLRGDTIPKGAVIVDTLVKVDTKLESAESKATVLVSAESEGDLQPSKKSNEAPWSTAGAKRGAVTATGTPVTTTAARGIVAKVGTEALTAGKFTVVVFYLEFA